MKIANTLKLLTFGWFFLVGCSFFLTGCYTPRYVYSPSAHNVPLLTQKGDSKIGINYSSNLPGTKTVDDPIFRGRSSGIDLQGAYAINKKFAVQLNYFSRTEKNGGNYSTSLDSAVIHYKRKLTEFGAGYYARLNTGSSLIFQLFAGAGFGDFDFIDNGKDANQVAYSRYHHAGILKLFIQPAFQYQDKKRVAASLSSRVSVINFRKVKTNYSRQEQENFELDRITSSPAVFWEPAFINTFGFKKLPGFFLEYQAGLSLLMSRRFVDARSFNFSLGVHADLPKLLKKKVAATPKNSPANEGSFINTMVKTGNKKRPALEKVDL
jgi:hypothetical protein